jgi:peptidoglycan hydrolase CwlO-like protein
MIKDVNQSLVDDNLVETDRIGSGAFFWALPSKGFQSRQNLQDNILRHTAEVQKEIDECHVKIQKEKEARDSLDGEREAMLAELATLQKESAELSEKMRVYEKCDPKRMTELKQKEKVCKEGMVRWTDNLYEMESWIRKNNPALSPEEVYQNFGILKDLDYIE